MARPHPALGPFALFQGSFALLYREFGRLFPVAFLPALALAAFAQLAGTSEPVPLDPVTSTTATGARFGALLLGLFLDVLVGFIVSGVLTLAALDALLGERGPIGDHLHRTLRQSGPILVLGTLFSILAGIGLALFIVPGLYILARFLPWLAAIVFEDAGWSGLTRAQELTEGRRWSLAGAITFFAILTIVLVFALAPFVAIAASAGTAALVLLEAAGTALYYALAASFTAVAYLRLRETPTPAPDGIS